MPAAGLAGAGASALERGGGRKAEEASGQRDGAEPVPLEVWSPVQQTTRILSSGGSFFFFPLTVIETCGGLLIFVLFCFSPQTESHEVGGSPGPCCADLPHPSDTRIFTTSKATVTSDALASLSSPFISQKRGAVNEAPKLHSQ